jgi:Domain of unknown function (DUF6398)
LAGHATPNLSAGTGTRRLLVTSGADLSFSVKQNSLGFQHSGHRARMRFCAVAAKRNQQIQPSGVGPIGDDKGRPEERPCHDEVCCAAAPRVRTSLQAGIGRRILNASAYAGCGVAHGPPDGSGHSKPPAPVFVEDDGGYLQSIATLGQIARWLTSLDVDRNQCDRCGWSAEPAFRVETFIPKEPQVATRSRSTAVPKTMQAKYDSVATLTDAFCRDHLNDEYRELARAMTAALCRKRPTPLVSGQPRVWACSIIYTLGQLNFLSDKATQPHMTMADVCAAFGVGQSTASAKARAISDALHTNRMDPTWMLRSLIDQNPFVWMAEVNGMLVDLRDMPREVQAIAYDKGLIPYIPADHQ